MRTSLVVVKPMPVTVMVSPTLAVIGLKVVMPGGGTTTKLVADTPVERVLETEIGPVVAAAGTTAVSWLSLETAKVVASIRSLP